MSVFNSERPAVFWLLQAASPERPRTGRYSGGGSDGSMVDHQARVDQDGQPAYLHLGDAIRSDLPLTSRMEALRD
jgi:hypothetical protein